MRILICEDDINDANKIKAYTEDFFSGKQVDIDICTPEDVVIQLEEQLFKYDIAIMDIYFEGCKLNGIDVSAMINEESIKCRIIYISNILEFAPQVYDTDHVYFVLKKNMNITLKRALKKAVISLEQELTEKIVEIVSENVKSHIKAKDIIYIERVQRTIKYVTAEKEYITYESLSKAVEKITTIVRCHGSFKVNLSHVKVVRADEIEMDNGVTIPVGRTYGDDFRQRYLEYYSEKL